MYFFSPQEKASSLRFSTVDRKKSQLKQSLKIAQLPLFFPILA